MNNADIRAHLRKGEQAVATLEALGYCYQTGRIKPQWVAPENPQDALKAAIQELIDTGIKNGLKERLKEETTKAFLAGERQAKEVDAMGPNWHIVGPYVGRPFRVIQDRIPTESVLRPYGSNHFAGVWFTASKIEYQRTPAYTGYQVAFQFPVRPFHKETVWIPLNACAFR